MKINDDMIKNAIQKANERLDKVHNYYERSKIKYDNCLDLFEEYIEKCKKVIPCDYSQNAIQNIKNNFMEIDRAKCFDMARVSPFYRCYNL